MNEVLFKAIDENETQHALHAGAVYRDDVCIVLPGSSGKGKSTLTAWLVKNGYTYLTDELIFLGDDGKITPFTRPINLKVGLDQLSWLIGADKKSETIIDEQFGTIISHRAIAPTFKPREPIVTHFIFPEYKEGSDCVLEEISPARSSLYLLKAHVNARNLEGHGVPALSKIVKGCRSFGLTYGSFNAIENIFSHSSDLFL